MTPAEYIEDIVLPTVREFMAKPGDRRLAYLAAQVVFHTVDYLMRTTVPAGSSWKIRTAELNRIEGLIRSDCPEFYAVVEGMCHGTKHCGRDGTSGHQFAPGDELYVRPFGFGEGFAGFDEGRWDGPGLIVVLSNGDRVFVDHAVPGFLLACQRHFPQHISGLDKTRWASASAK